ncbi:MAG: hypothetical protein JO062_07920 [Bryobacterales bacterium]|nr:hypothetical protein [Bryobacterales bacterium]
MKAFLAGALFLCLAVGLPAQATLSNSDVIKMANAGLSDDFVTNLIDQQGSQLSSDVASLIDMKNAGVNERILTAVSKKAPASEPLNGDSVLRLTKAGLSDNFIADLINRQPSKFTVSGSRIVELKEAGVSERILSLMVSDSGARDLPAGTQISVRLIDSIDSEKDKSGDEFRASLADPITIGDNVIVPRGADARVRLTEDKQSGKFTGKAELTVQLLSVVVNGKTVPISTSSVTEYSKSQTGSTVKRAAIVGAAGAIIGGLAGGGKGAGIGAGAGAAAGGGSGVFMKGQRVKIPSETLLTFTTEQVVRLP